MEKRSDSAARVMANIKNSKRSERNTTMEPGKKDLTDVGKKVRLRNTTLEAQRTHWKGAKSLEMQQEKSTIIDPIHDDMENLMGIIQGTLMAERAEGNATDLRLKAARFRNFIGKEYLTPSSLTKGVLSFCQATRKRPAHVS